jgi:hypothetical protein
VADQLAQHLGGEIEPDGDADDHLPELASARHGIGGRVGEAQRRHRQQRADEPGQGHVERARRIAGDGAGGETQSPASRRRQGHGI